MFSCLLCMVFLSLGFPWIFFYTVSLQMEIWLLFQNLHNWLNVLLTMLTFLSWSIFFPLRSCKGKSSFWGTPLYIDGGKYWGQEVPTWYWPGSEECFCSLAVSILGCLPLLDCAYPWSLGTSWAAMLLLKLSCVWCAWWIDSKVYSHDLLSRRCRSWPLGRPESVPCKSCMIWHDLQ